jgi:hypothetical protein
LVFVVPTLLEYVLYLLCSVRQIRGVAH